MKNTGNAHHKILTHLMPINKKIASPDIPDDGQCFRISAKVGQRYDYNGKKYRRLSQSFKQPTRGQTPGLLHSDLVLTLALITH